MQHKRFTVILWIWIFASNLVFSFKFEYVNVKKTLHRATAVVLYLPFFVGITKKGSRWKFESAQICWDFNVAGREKYLPDRGLTFGLVRSHKTNYQVNWAFPEFSLHTNKKTSQFIIILPFAGSGHRDTGSQAAASWHAGHQGGGGQRNGVVHRGSTRSCRGTICHTPTPTPHHLWVPPI